MIRSIKHCPCGNIAENQDTGECASCAGARRKAERRRLAEKKPLKKTSAKKQNEIDQYAVLRQAFLLRKWCAVHGKAMPANRRAPSTREGRLSVTISPGRKAYQR